MWVTLRWKLAQIFPTNDLFICVPLRRRRPVPKNTPVGLIYFEKGFALNRNMQPTWAELLSPSPWGPASKSTMRSTSGAFVSLGPMGRPAMTTNDEDDGDMLLISTGNLHLQLKYVLTFYSRQSRSSTTSRVLVRECILIRNVNNRS